jgi:hypothetical protein
MAFRLMSEVFLNLGRLAHPIYWGVRMRFENRMAL